MTYSKPAHQELRNEPPHALDGSGSGLDQMSPDPDLEAIADAADAILTIGGMWVLILKVLTSWFGINQFFWPANYISAAKRKKEL